MCDEGRPQETPHGIRIFEGRYLDAYVGRRAAQPGYVVAIWRGSHVTDLRHLTSEDRAGYWDEVVRVSEAVAVHFDARKVNYEVLGNVMPHLHTHITARFAEDDVAGGAPIPSAERDRALDPERVSRDAAALSHLLTG
jgi:diadenosine tetraphosphate (Ap4A) HIT family hydrolase